MFNIDDYKKGTFTKVTTERSAKLRKDYKHLNITKVTTYTNCRLGIAYDNMSQTVENRKSGELPTKNAGLKWGQWKQFPYIIEHKGNEYLRVYADIDNTETKWFFNGEEVKKNEISDYLLSSEFSKPTNDKYLTLTINVNNIK